MGITFSTKNYEKIINIIENNTNDTNANNNDIPLEIDINFAQVNNLIEKIINSTW